MENEEFISVRYRNILECLKAFFRRKWLFIISIYVGLVVGIMACFMLPQRWKSSTCILVEEEKIINPLIQNLAVSTTAAQRLDSIREVLLSWTSLTELTKRLHLDKGVRDKVGFEKLIVQLRENIQVRMREANIILISYLGNTPEETQLVAKTLTDILIEKNKQSQTRETDVAIGFIKEQLAIYKRKIKEAEIASMEDQLKTLLVDSTEAHPMVKELRQKITVAKNELDSGGYEVKGPAQPIDPTTREALKRELDKLLTTDATASSASPQAYAKVTSEVMDKVDSTLARDKSVNETIYDMLLQRLETAKMTKRLEDSREGTRYTIIDPPRVPLKPDAPNKPKVILAFLLLGAAAGSGLVLGREFMDHSILDIEDAKHTLELPILGAISRLTTQEEIDRARVMRKTFITVGLLVTISLIITSALISLLKR
jgi:uncharacterized protein involved in exopolysaccharide biosynthesis